MEPSYTSSLLDIMTIMVSGNKNQGNCKTKGYLEASKTNSGIFPVKKMHKMMNIN